MYKELMKFFSNLGDKAKQAVQRLRTAVAPVLSTIVIDSMSQPLGPSSSMGLSSITENKPFTFGKSEIARYMGDRLLQDTKDFFTSGHGLKYIFPNAVAMALDMYRQSVMKPSGIPLKPFYMGRDAFSPFDKDVLYEVSDEQLQKKYPDAYDRLMNGDTLHVAVPGKAYIVNYGNVDGPHSSAWEKLFIPRERVGSTFGGFNVDYTKDSRYYNFDGFDTNFARDRAMPKNPDFYQLARILWSRFGSHQEEPANEKVYFGGFTTPFTPYLLRTDWPNETNGTDREDE